MKHTKNFAEINLKETCTHILPDGVIVDVIYYPYPYDRYSVTVGNANLAEGQWYGNAYCDLSYITKVVDYWIENSKNKI